MLLLPHLNSYLKMVLACLVYNCPGSSLSADAMNAINDGVELYSMQLFEDSPSSVVSNWIIIPVSMDKDNQSYTHNFLKEIALECQRCGLRHV